MTMPQDYPPKQDRSTAPATASGRPLIEVQNLGVTFESLQVLHDVHVTIQAGETLAVIGESGCGKTVFMKSLVGLIQPTRGTVRFDGLNLSQLSLAQLSDVRKRFGFVFQNAALFDSMSIYDNIAFPMRQSTSASESEIQHSVLRHLNEVGPANQCGPKAAQ